MSCGLPTHERRAIWGAPIDPLDALTDFNPEDINNAELGAA